MMKSPNRFKKSFLRNGYSRYLIDQKVKLFLHNEKPEKPEINATLCLNYTCANTETYCKFLVSKMKNTIPKFNVNISLRTVKISQLFSRSAKAENLSIYDTPECIYHFCV